jgi:rhamnose transport system permease protein
MADRIVRRLRSWDGLLLAVVAVVLVLNWLFAPNYLTVQNQVNLWQNGIEKAIVVLAMAFVIINGEIDLSVASMMGLSAVVVAVLWEQGFAIEIAIVMAILTGVGLGLFNGFWVAIVGLPSLVVTLAGLIGFRGLALILIEDRSIGNSDTAFPRWFEDIGQQPLAEFIGVLGALPVLERVPLAMFFYFGLLVLAAITLGMVGFGRKTYVIGASFQVARYSGVGVAAHKMAIMTLSATVAAIAGVFLASHLGAVRGSTAFAFELDIITIVLLGGVSIFGGSGTMLGVFLATLLVLNIRNGLGLQSVPGHTQTGVVGLLLILSVLLPNVFARFQDVARRRSLARAAGGSRDGPESSTG